MDGILGTKIGMTQVFTEGGDMIPVTVVEAIPCTVVQKKSVEKDKYEAVQLGFLDKNPKRVNKPLLGHFKKYKVKPVRVLKEIRCDTKDVKSGQTIHVDIFNVGEKVKVTGISKGCGFAGVVKKFGFKGSTSSRGSHEVFRHGGSIGMASYPGKVFKGKKMPGHLGNSKVTIKNVEVAAVKKDENLILLKGAVPGHNGGLLVIKRSG